MDLTSCQQEVILPEKLNFLLALPWDFKGPEAIFEHQSALQVTQVVSNTRM